MKDVYTAVRLLKKHGIRPKVEHHVRDDSRTRRPRTFTGPSRSSRSLDVPNVMFAIATPFKGTEFFDYCKEKGYLIDESDNVNPMGKSMISYPQLTGTQLEELERYAYRSFYGGPRWS